jgi:hypothetical protein
MSDFYKAEDLAERLKISLPKAYQIIREWNEELASKGYYVMTARIPVKFYEDKVYGLSGRKEMSSAGV